MPCQAGYSSFLTGSNVLAILINTPKGHCPAGQNKLNGFPVIYTQNKLVCEKCL